MSACEECWAQASQDVMLLGGSVVDRYRQRSGEHDVRLADARQAERAAPRRATAPRRIQRQRTKGWRMPTGARYVGRPSRWGNPYTVGDVRSSFVTGLAGEPAVLEQLITPAVAAELYRRALLEGIVDVPPLDEVAELRGLDLACWCPLGQPCHADVLLELANPGVAA